MSYISEEKTENVTHTVKTGNKCDYCYNQTKIIDDPSWHGFYVQTYYYNSDANDHDYYDVCCPECYFKLLEEKLEDSDPEDWNNFEFAGMNRTFSEKLLKYYKEGK